MRISNFNLYKSEWLELVFENRNKEYGAYYIRQHYSTTIVKAMAITFASVVSAAFLVGIAIRVKPITERMITVPLDKVFEVQAVKPKEPPKPKTAAAPAKPVSAKKYIQMVVTATPTTVEPPKMSELEKVDVGPIEIKVPGENGTPGPDGKGKGIGTGIAPGDGPDNDNKEVVLAPDVLPEPIGGAAAWAKFLQNNLRYPREALDRQMGGRVYVSFVVEKDGHLSSITIDRGVGFGMDEEAARVLKLAKAWKPGLQAGRPVRVKYTLPVVFTVSD